MNRTVFLVKGFGASGKLVLESVGEGKPLTRKKAFVKGTLLGEVLETIGRVENPLYVLAPAKGVEAEKLLGKRICVNLK